MNGTIVYGTGFGSQYLCTFDPLSAPPGTQVSVAAWQYNATSYTAFPSGWFVYISHSISNFAQKAGAFFTLLGYVLTPINFNILGYTIADIGGFALMFVIGVYVVAYIFIGIFIYKTISPWSSVS